MVAMVVMPELLVMVVMARLVILQIQMVVTVAEADILYYEATHNFGLYSI